MSTTANLVVNGDCETGPLAPDFGTYLAPAGWTLDSGQLDAVAYAAGSSNDLDTAYAAAHNGGTGYFSGGPSAGISVSHQTIDVSGYGAKIDAGGVSFDFAGDFGGWSTQDDRFSGVVTFYAADGTTVLGTSGTLGNFVAGDRGGISSLIHDGDTGTVPVGTRFVKVELTATRDSGAYNDGYADNISFTLTGNHLADNIIVVTKNHDYSAASLSGKDTIQFSATKNATATFVAEQFGPGIAPNALVIGDSHNNTVVINVAPTSGVFVGASFQFSSWEAKDKIVINGSSVADELTGTAVADTISGGLGGDTIRGGLGADLLKGEGDFDTFRYGINESVGAGYDTIDGYDAVDDRIDVSLAGINFNIVDAPVTVGALSSKHVDKGLKNAVDDTHLGKNDAVLFTPDSGNLAGHTFLVIDANHHAGYQVGDIVIELTNASNMTFFSAGDILD